MKSLGSLLVCICTIILFAVTAQAADELPAPTLHLVAAPNATAYSVVASGFTGAAAIEFTITYDSTALKTPTVALGSLSNVQMLANGETPGTLRVAIVTTSRAGFAGNGTISNITFTRVGSAVITPPKFAGNVYMMDSTNQQPVVTTTGSCPIGQVLVGGVCKTPPTCRSDQILSVITCICPSGKIEIGGVCQAAPVCTGGQILVGTSCQCTSGQSFIDGSCQTPTASTATTTAAATTAAATTTAATTTAATTTAATTTADKAAADKAAADKAAADAEAKSKAAVTLSALLNTNANIQVVTENQAASDRAAADKAASDKAAADKAASDRATADKAASDRAAAEAASQAAAQQSRSADSPDHADAAHQEAVADTKKPVASAVGKLRSIPNSLDRFSAIVGERTLSAYQAIFTTNVRDNGFTQEPPIAISDGKAAITMTIEMDSKGENPNFAFQGASAKSVRKTGEKTWLLEAIPEKGAMDVKAIISVGKERVDVPMVVVPEIDPVIVKRTKGLSEEGVETLLSRKDLAPDRPAYDLNGDGKRDYQDDYILVGHYLLNKKEGAEKK